MDGQDSISSHSWKRNIWHVAAGNIGKELFGRIIHFVINGQDLDETTKIEVIHAMKKSPLYNEDE